MNHYLYQKDLKQIWEDAVTKYKSGNQEPDSYFSHETLDQLRTIGLNTMDVYDYAEDFVSGEEPDFETFLMICEVRRDYFFTVQKGRHSNHLIDVNALPGKEEKLQNIEWLPRIIPKALGKLRGELPSEIMYCCGGDRRFLKTNNIHPAEFLRVVWAYHDNESKIIDWVLARKEPLTH